MVNSGSTLFPRKHSTNQEPSFPSTAPNLRSEVAGHFRAFSTNMDNSEQGRITMKTRIAVRDTTPHRFQIIPLREAKNNQVAPNPTRQWPKLSETSSCSPDTIPTPTKQTPSQQNLSSVPLPTFVYGGGSGRAHPTLSHRSKNKNNSCIERTLLPRSTPTQSSHNEDRSCPLSTGFKAPLCTGSSKVHKKGAHSEIISQNLLNGGLGCQEPSNKVKARICSEDLVRHKSQPLQDCVRAPLILDESTWCPNKRHAIYADSMTLRLSEPSPAQNFFYPGLQSLQIDHSICRHCRGQVRCIEDSSGWPPSRNLTGVSTEAAPGLGPRAIPLGQFSEESQPSMGYLSSPPVARLRPSGRPRDPTNTSSTVISKLSAVHTRSIKHSKAIVKLLSQLDEAIIEWDNLERLFA